MMKTIYADNYHSELALIQYEVSLLSYYIESIQTV